MKRTLGSILLGCLTLGVWAQEYKVSTEVQSKNVLLEEFTGIYCSYCPEGHQIAQRLKTALGDRMNVVAIHCGPFAPTGNDQNDLTVGDGHALGYLLGGANGGFPNGCVNRQDWQHKGELYYGRGYWDEFARQTIAEQAPVNLWATAEMDASSRMMKITVEGYYTDDQKGEEPRLNLLLTQSNIYAMQSGANSGARYSHQHVLRDAITDVEGDVLPQGKKGEYFKKEYQYRVRGSFKVIKTVPADLDLVVFVTQGTKNVLNAITVKPGYVGETLPLEAAISPCPIPMDGGYRYNFAEFELTNRCNSTLTSATFKVTLNDEVKNVEWKGEVSPFATQRVRIPVDWGQKAGKSNTYKITLKALNGEALFGNSIDGRFKEPVTVPEKVTVRINTDEFAEENTYRLYDMDGNCIRSFGPFESGKFHQYKEDMLLEPHTGYCLEVTDAWGNGVYPHGNAVELLSESGVALFQQYSVKDFGVRLFFQTGTSTGLTEVRPQEGGGMLEVYDLTGKLVQGVEQLQHLPKGGYLVRSASGVRKVIVK